MTDNPAAECQDPREIAHWCDNKCWQEDAELLADVHKWRHLRANLDAVHADPDADFSNIHEMAGRLQDLQGRLVKHTPISFLGAGFYLGIAAEAMLKHQTDPDDARGDIGFALALIVCVNEAFEHCDSLWINWKDVPNADRSVERLNTA